MVVAGIVLACAVFVVGRAVEVRQEIGVDAAPARTPTQVEVTNFPAVQPVSGAVNVGNLPAVQAVSGSVQVDNLPLDDAGRLLVALPTIQIGNSALVVQSTTATYQGDLGGRTGATQKCRIEFPGSHFANMNEVQYAYGVRGIIWLSSETDSSWIDEQGPVNCMEWRATTNTDGSRIDGRAIRAQGTDIGNGWPCTTSLPILCAE
jgi:hypothetical protein